jgi:hypothetical protein
MRGRMNMNPIHQFRCTESPIAFWAILQIVARIVVLDSFEQVTNEGQDEYEPHSLQPVS